LLVFVENKKISSKSEHLFQVLACFYFDKPIFVEKKIKNPNIPAICRIHWGSQALTVDLSQLELHFLIGGLYHHHGRKEFYYIEYLSMLLLSPFLLLVCLLYL